MLGLGLLLRHFGCEGHCLLHRILFLFLFLFLFHFLILGRRHGGGKRDFAVRRMRWKLPIISYKASLYIRNVHP